MSSASADLIEIQAPRPAPQSPEGERRFGETRFVRKKRRNERLARGLLLAMTLSIILPLLLIVGFLFYKAWPLLSWEFMVNKPTNGIRAGGVLSPILGKLYIFII